MLKQVLCQICSITVQNMIIQIISTFCVLSMTFWMSSNCMTYRCWIENSRQIWTPVSSSQHTPLSRLDTFTVIAGSSRICYGSPSNKSRHQAVSFFFVRCNVTPKKQNKLHSLSSISKTNLIWEVSKQKQKCRLKITVGQNICSNKRKVGFGHSYFK